MLMESLWQDPGGPGSPTEDADPGRFWDSLAGAGGAVEAGAPAHPSVAGARQEGAPAALPALGRDKGRSPGPSSAGAAEAARALRVRAAGPAPGATPAPRPPPPDFSAPEVARAQAGVARDLQAPARPPPARPAPACSVAAAAEEAETAGRRRLGERSGRTRAMAPVQRPLFPVLLMLLLPPPLPPLARAEDAARANSDRYAVYWNRSNPR